jgi:hypothetical protein
MYMNIVYYSMIETRDLYTRDVYIFFHICLLYCICIMYTCSFYIKCVYCIILNSIFICI